MSLLISQLTFPKQGNGLQGGIQIQLLIITNATKAVTSKLVLLKANCLAVPSFEEVWEVFLHAADKYKKIPVLIIDNANRLCREAAGAS
jgi:hypothetical protein